MLTSLVKLGVYSSFIWHMLGKWTSFVNSRSDNDNTIHDGDYVGINTNANDTYNNAYITCKLGRAFKFYLAYAW